MMIAPVFATAALAAPGSRSGARARPSSSLSVTDARSIRGGPAKAHALGRALSVRGMRLRGRAGPRDNPGFDPNDPMTWNAPAKGAEEEDAGMFEEMAAPVDDLMQLSDDQLAQLLGAEGASVPVMLEDGELGEETGASTISPGDLPPATAGEAIDRGLALYKAGDYNEALASFTRALDLPGTGPIRRRKAKVMPAGPSQGFADADVSLNEQIAIHYNSACCHARLEDPKAGLVSLVRALEAGYDDFDNIRSDPDTALLRTDPRFEGIMKRFEPQGLMESVFAMMSKGTTREQAKKGGAPKGGGGAELLGGIMDAVKSKLENR